MTAEDIWSVAGALLFSLTGGGLIVAVLFKWLGEVTAKRILQREQGAILKGIEELRQELSLLKTNYEKNSDWIIEFYSMFYRHYQAAFRAAKSDMIQHPDRTDENTKETYMDKVDTLAFEWNEMQSAARILLPSTLLSLHECAVDKLNNFKDAVKVFDNSDTKSRRLVEVRFNELHDLKDEMESEIRKYLKSEKLGKNHLTSVSS